ncbi:ROK family protein [Flavobacterium sp.]
MATTTNELKILAIDIGGTHIKTTLLDINGKLLTEYKSVDTPHPATPDKIVEAIKGLIDGFPPFDKVAVGFPGYVKQGTVYSAPNLENKLWQNVDLTTKLKEIFGQPTRVVNDADMQGLGIVSGKGFEMMITLGTGFGTALLKDGKLLPHIELAHHPVTKKKNYDEYLGAAALEKIGVKKWNRRLQKILEILKTVFNYDRLYLGGGNASKINFELDDNIMIVNNEDGIHGGAALWK